MTPKLVPSVVLPLMIAGLAGCASFPNPASPSKLSAEAVNSSANGVVVMSSGAPDSCASAGRYLNLYDAHSRAQVTTVPPIFMDFATQKSDFADHHGLVSAYALPAGDYYLTPVLANPMTRKVSSPEFAFHVTAGETAYLGEVFMIESCGLNNKYVVNDRYDRDVPLALAANAQLVARQPVKHLMQGSN